MNSGDTPPLTELVVSSLTYPPLVRHLSVWNRPGLTTASLNASLTQQNRDAMKLQDPKVLSDWLGQDIPHRLRAALSLSPLLEEMLLKALPDDPQAREAKAKFCLEMGAWEGTFVATRWLIEFVGVNGDAAGNPIESRRRMERRLPPNKKPRHGFDVDIMDMPGGDYIDLTTANAKLLGAVWKGCSQASAHATHGSNHPSIARDRLTDALRIVVNHLQRTVFNHAGRQVQI